MKASEIAVGVILVAAGVLSFGDVDAQDNRPVHNPFARPAELMNPPSPAAQAARPETLAAPPVLSATLTSAHQPMAILGGRLMTLGEEHGGYRLVDVSEGSAVFLHNHAEVRLVVSEPLAAGAGR